MNKFFICSSSACMERMMDSEKIHAYLVINGWDPAGKVSEADLVIINTCSFGTYEDDSSIDLIKHYSRRKKKTARTIITGCLSTINPSKLKGIDMSFALSPVSLHKLDEIIEAKVKFNEVCEPNRILGSEVSYRPSLKKILNTKTLLDNFFNQFMNHRSFYKKQLSSIKKIISFLIFMKAYINPFLVCIRSELFYLRISKGCLGNCSYCAKRFATGRLKSKPKVEIINEFKKGLSQGYKKFFMLSEDAGCYGIDSGTTINQLIREIFILKGNHEYKLIISNFNAEWLVKYFNEIQDIILANHDRILYFHVPIQSGSNRILQLMNRPYQIEEVESCLFDLRTKIPNLNITTDMIVGFPGETEIDFKLSKEFLEKVKFNFVDIFGYENRPNTPASKMNGKLSQDIIDKRKFELLKIQNQYARFNNILKKVIEVARDFA
jgi:tRNA A37 methylthiotransferase MiaB